MTSFRVLRCVPRWLGWLTVVLVLPLLMLGACQSRLIYFPRPYANGAVTRWQAHTAGIPIDYSTRQGHQRAFLQGNRHQPRNLWVVCGGNGSLALDWSDWLTAHAPRADAWLLVDFPGYGDCKGNPSPESIRESLAKVLPLAWQATGNRGATDPERLRFFGHSLGSAACLLAASDAGIHRGVLLAPFTSTMDMCHRITGLPLGFLVWHRFDNRARLAELDARQAAAVTIVHGSDDEVIPYSMSRSLADSFPRSVRLIGIPGGHHNSLQETHPETLAKALEDAAGS